MDNRPLGVFDSGLGGLTAAEKLRRIMPEENLVYFGDTYRMPYGGRSYDEILKIARQNVEFMQSFNVKAMIAACGTISSNVLHIIKNETTVPLFGVLDPAVKSALNATRNGRIGVIATQAAISSKAYVRRIQEADPKLSITDIACPKFAPLIESGHFDAGEESVKDAVREYLAPVKEGGIDTLILGCTHYPLLAEAIFDFLGEGVLLVDSGAEAAKALSEFLKLKDMTAGTNSEGSEIYYTSGKADAFSDLAEIFLGRDIRKNVTEILPLPL